jgi:Tetracyclin repressor-like, C-terminal domain
MGSGQRTTVVPIRRQPRTCISRLGSNGPKRPPTTMTAGTSVSGNRLGPEVRQISTAAVMSLADAIEDALPGLGHAGAYDAILAAYSLAAPLWQVANPPKKLAEAYAEAKATDLPPDWNIDFTAALTRLIRATCAGLIAEPQKLEQG